MFLRCLLQLGDDIFEFLIHFEMVLHRHESLRAQGWSAAIPKKMGLPGEIKERHAIAGADAVFDSGAETTRIGEGGGACVAARAGKCAIAREGGVIEQELSQCDTFFQQRIVPW